MKEDLLPILGCIALLIIIQTTVIQVCLTQIRDEVRKLGKHD